jgi:signal transduction histidine kinase
MFNFILEILCASLVSMSLIFIVIEIRSHFDKSFIIFGCANLLLAIFCSIDIWLQPTAQTIHWTKIQHIIAAFFPAFITWYLMVALKKQNLLSIRLMFFLGFAFALLFSTNLMLKPSHKEIISTPLYNYTFAPYMLIAMIGITVFLIRNLSYNNSKNIKVIIFHLIGICALSIGGILDMITVFVGHRINEQVATFSMPGLLAFGIIVTYVFIDRLTAIIRDREIIFGKLQVAYREMEAVQSLKELGQSTAIINHEIKNYTCIISGYAQYLQENGGLQARFHDIVGRILDTANRLSDFSKEILDFSKAKILSDKRQLDLRLLLQSCIQAQFNPCQDSFDMDEMGEGFIIHGDWNKLEHAFVNIFKNAFEAQASKIRAKATQRNSMLLLTIEDDGVGCTEEEFCCLFKSFYTTKKGSGGTGLGMCIIRSIIESHGGHISAYSKNLLNSGNHGLIFNICFPLYTELDDAQASDRKDNVVLIKEGIQNLALVLRVFQNASVNPSIVQGFDDFHSHSGSYEGSAVYGSTKVTTELIKKFNQRQPTYTLVENAKNMVFVIDENVQKKIHLFSEDFLLASLRNPARE